jgi:predicted site-specific integrase-resolvase
MDRIYTPEQLADHLQVSADTLEYWRRTGKGPDWFPAGRHPRYRESAILAWEKEQEQEARQARSA